MPTGKAWDLTDPLKPVCRWDLNAARRVPWNWSKWLADAAATYQSHQIIGAPTFEEVNAFFSNGRIMSLLRVVPSQTPALDSLWPVTCRIFSTDGQSDDQTLWFRIVAK